MANTPINKTIYLRANQASTLNRTMKPLTETKKTQANQIVSKFITLLKAAHS
jgi:hypothetical protein